MVNNATTQLESINNTAYDSGKNMVSEYSQGAKDESNSTDYSELGENIVAGITEPMGDSNSELTIGDVVSRFFDKFVGENKRCIRYSFPCGRNETIRRKYLLRNH